MSILVWRSCKAGNEETFADVQRICGAYGPENWRPTSPQDICNRILHTVYMGMATQSSSETRSRAKRLSEAIGSYHTDMNIDDVFEAQKKIITQATGCEPKFRAHGGSNSENLLLQNIQARSRMVTAYAMAQHLPLVRKRPGGGSLLVLGSSNVDECLRGYYTKVSPYSLIGSRRCTDVSSMIVPVVSANVSLWSLS
jgi:NAD+ synthase (glutamine-hydrolysing)